MAESVFVVSEWLAKEGYESELWDRFSELMALARTNESGCIRAHVTRQISHPGAPGTSKYTIVLLQEYKHLAAFDQHCAADYVRCFVQTAILDEHASIVAAWTCRLFSPEKASP